MRSAALVLLVSLAFTLCACSMVPATQGDLEEMQAAQRTFTEASVTAAAEGNDATAILLAGMAGITSIFTTVGLSRRRRSAAALVQATGSAVPPSLQPTPA